MATSPPTVDTNEVKNYDIEPKEFGENLSKLCKEHNEIFKLASVVYSLGKTEKLVYPNGKTIGRKELKNLSAQFCKKVKELKKNFVARGKKKKRTRKSGTIAGFKNPIIVTDNMRAFFAVANLGPSDPRNPSSEPLGPKLAVGVNGVTTRAIMTPVFNIYAYVNHMQKDNRQGFRQLLTATPQMDQYFTDTYTRLAALPQRFKKADKNGYREPIRKFESKSFRYASIQQIVADNSIPRPGSKGAKERPHLTPLTAEQSTLLENPEMKVRLEQEQVLVSGILEYYRWIKSGSKKPFEVWATEERAKKAAKKARESA